MDNKRGIDRIIALIVEAQQKAAKLGYPNLLQPGLVKELVMGNILGHEVHRTKHQADAWEPDDPGKQYEYLSCFAGGTFQLDRMFKAPADKREKSLLRITRNNCFYCAVFEQEEPLTVRTIYRVPTERIHAETVRQLDTSKNDISHVGFTEKWVSENGAVVYANSRR